MLKYFLIIIFITLGLTIMLLQNYSKDNSNVLSSRLIVISPILTLTLSPTSSRIPSLTPTPSIFLKKDTYSIAIFGDSMVDTMGEELEYLQKNLTDKYPRVQFNLYNYGIGGQNVEQGLARFESSFVNRERKYPPLPVLSPDVLILGSFAYNPFSTHDSNKHYTLLKEIIIKAKTMSSRLYLLAEIAPLKTGFGEGKNGVNMPADTAYQQAVHILEQLDNVVNLSASENIPLVNVYHQSKIDGMFGDPYFVNSDDGIHPSVAGQSFTAQIIMKNIKFD